MKVIHLYARNLTLFEDALDGTGCRVNGSKDLGYMHKSLTSFNARDVMGLIVFRSPMTKKTLKLVRAFDDLFVFDPKPIVIISDQATALYASGKIKVKNSPLFLVDSEENTISDIDLKRVLATLSCVADEMYDMSEIEARRVREVKDRAAEKTKHTLLADEVLAACAALGGATKYADYRKARESKAKEKAGAK